MRFPVYFVAYIVTILVLNLGFSYVPMIDLGFGMLSPMAVVAGAVFVLRDYVQQDNGHMVVIAMAVGVLLSFVLADPFVALASAVAFGVSELGDYLIYTFTKKPFHQRVLASSLISTPIDTAIFLFMINGVTLGTFVLMVASKMVAAFVLWYVYQYRANRPLVG